MGGVVGVVFGCLFAMTQLLFKDQERDDNMKQFAEVKKCFETLMSEDGCNIGADQCTLFLLDKDEKHLFSVASGGEDKIYIEFPAYKGIAGKALTTGTAINIPNAYEVPYFNSDVDKTSGYKTTSVLAVPIFEKSKTGARVVAVAQFINKIDRKSGKIVPFDDQDVASAERACRYIAMFKPIIDGLVN